jgi:hypothetical protein
MSDVIGLDRIGTLGAVDQFAIEPKMYTRMGHLINCVLLKIKKPT